RIRTGGPLLPKQMRYQAALRPDCDDGIRAALECGRMPKFDADKWLAISAMVVSIGTLVALAYQSMLMREAERASKLPYLYFSLLSNSQQGVEVLLINSGIGPA